MNDKPDNTIKNAKPKIILDVDTGTNDAVAIMLLVLSGKLNVLGKNIPHRNRAVDNCGENTLRVLSHRGYPNPPISEGYSKPKVKNLTKGRLANNPGVAIEIKKGNSIHSTIS